MNQFMLSFRWNYYNAHLWYIYCWQSRYQINHVDWIMITHKLQSKIGTHASVSSLCSSYVHVAVMLPSVVTGELCYTPQQVLLAPCLRWCCRSPDQLLEQGRGERVQTHQYQHRPTVCVCVCVFQDNMAIYVHKEILSKHQSMVFGQNMKILISTIHS